MPVCARCLAHVEGLEAQLLVRAHVRGRADRAPINWALPALPGVASPPTPVLCDLGCMEVGALGLHMSNGDPYGNAYAYCARTATCCAWVLTDGRRLLCPRCLARLLFAGLRMRCCSCNALQCAQAGCVVVSRCVALHTHNNALCPQTYCSEACRGADRGPHGLLCVGPCEAGDALVEFKLHAVASSGEAFLLVAKAIAAVWPRARARRSIVIDHIYIYIYIYIDHGSDLF